MVPLSGSHDRGLQESTVANASDATILVERLFVDSFNVFHVQKDDVFPPHLAISLGKRGQVLRVYLERTLERRGHAALALHSTDGVLFRLSRRRLSRRYGSRARHDQKVAHTNRTRDLGGVARTAPNRYSHRTLQSEANRARPLGRVRGMRRDTTVGVTTRRAPPRSEVCRRRIGAIRRRAARRALPMSWRKRPAHEGH
jgi:hypothetical protein